MNKKEVRKIHSQVRAVIADREQKNASICEKALELALKHKSVFSYVSIGSEVDTYEIIERLRVDKTVFVPYTFDGIMHAVKLNCDADLSGVDGRGNILGINGEFFDGQADLIFVPLLGFDKDCYRIGYGAGCYDRYFDQFPQGLKVGLAYDEQLCAFAKSEYDIPLDMIITPTRIYRRSK